MTAARSQNGWTVLTQAPPPVPVPGTNVSLTVRPGDVAVVLVEVARRWDDEVEDLDTADHPHDRAPAIAGGAPSELRDDWGWAYRPVRGKTTGFSNHASATAIDLNATQHPRGVPGTFTAAQIRAVRAILADLVDPVTSECVVRWGEDYTTTVDGMHFEINADAAAVARVAELVRAGRTRDPLEALMALDPQERAALLAELADVVLHTPRPLGPAARRELGREKASLFDLAQIAAASAVDTRQAAGRIETDLADGVPVEGAAPGAGA